jgi:dihydrofolate reductase
MSAPEHSNSVVNIPRGIENTLNIMRTLKLQVQTSVDGYKMDDKLHQFITDLTAPVDTIVMGHNLAKGFIPYWESAAGKQENNDGTDDKMSASEQQVFNAFAHKMNDTAKVVFSRTLDKSEWARTSIAKGDLTEEINKLKAQSGGVMIVYGGSEFVTSLIHEGLIDELNLFVNPTAIGNGMRIFDHDTKLELVSAKPFSCGIVVLTYTPKS